MADTFLFTLGAQVETPHLALVQNTRAVVAHLGVTTREVDPARFVAFRTDATHRPLGRQHALSANVGLSLGPHQQVQTQGFYIDGPGSPEFTRKWGIAYFLNADLGWELRTSDALSFRVYMGMARLMNPTAFRCSGYDAATCEHPERPTRDFASFDHQATEYYFYIGTELILAP